MDESQLPETDDAQIYFGLTHTPRPHQKTQFAHIFTEQWSNRILSRLLRELKKQLMTENSETEQILKMKKEFDRLSRSLAHKESEHRRLEEDYGNVLQLSLEVMELLQSSLKGQPVSIGQDLVARMADKLVSRPSSAVTDVPTRPSSAFLTPTSIIDTFQTSEYTTIPTIISKSETPLPSGRPINLHSKSLFTYNYEAMKKDMLHHGGILQSLRLKLTAESQTYDARLKLLKEYVLADVLGCSTPTSEYHRKITIAFSTPTDIKLRQSLQRYVNTLASIFIGRKYLSNSHLIIPALETALVTETDIVCREHLLGALQKLSLRRVVQSQMIRGGKVMVWLIENLSDPDNLSEYLLEYAAALLMNLCLRTKGRCSLLNQAENLLRVLTDLLSHENQNFKTYLNGTLYSVLKMENFKEQARAMGLKAMLDSYMKLEQPDSEHYTVCCG